MVAITLQHVSKHFDAFAAVDDISLDIQAGELFFLLGPSGCGKTTLLRLLAGFYMPDSGRILFDGHDVSDIPPHKRNTGMIFQNYALWPHMTVRKNLAFGLDIRKTPAAESEARIMTALKMVRMEEYAEKSPNQLSGGQQQRVAVARALVLEPDVVLLDEPLSNLDAKLRLEMRAEIARIHDEVGLTMVYVTHDQSEALSMADRVAIMNAGRIIQIGTPRDIYNRPRDPFVAEFIGETNFLPGTVSKITDASIEIHTPAGTLSATVFPPELAEGDAVTCSIRPESLRPADADSSFPNRLSGTVKRVMYLGSHQQYFLSLNGEIRVKALEYGASRIIESGSTIRVGCQPEDVVVFKEAVRR